MSVTIDDIHAAGTFTEPNELAENTQILSQSTQCTHIIGQKDDDLQRIPKDKFYGPGQPPYLLGNDTRTYQLTSAGVLYGTNLTQMWCDVSSTFRVRVNSNTFLQITGAFLWTTFYYAFKSSPSGAGIYVYCDGFVEWSMAHLKDNITSIPPDVISKPLIPREYTQNGKQRLGFVVEESPSEIIVSTTNEEGKEDKGIDIMALCALQQAKINDLEKRLSVLEAIK